MIQHSAYAVEPWAVRETTLDVDVLDQAGSVFALANGHIGLRGNLDEGEPPGLPGTYLNGFYEQHALPYAEAGYGYPEAGQTTVNVTNGKIIRSWSTTSRSTYALGSCAVTSECLTSEPACSAVALNGCPLPASMSVSRPSGWFRSCSGRWRRCSTRWSR